MTDNVKHFIEDHITLIDNNDFEQFYRILLEEDYISEISGMVTDALLEAGINPLQFLDRVPAYYLSCSTEVQEFRIPDHVRRIGFHALSGSRVEKLIINPNVTLLHTFCCYASDYLREIVFEPGCKAVLTDNCFNNCSSIKVVEFPDTMSILPDKKPFAECTNFTVRCVEGSSIHKWAVDNMYKVEFIF